MTITSKYPTTCKACGATLPPGSAIQWRKGAGSTCATCPTPTSTRRRHTGSSLPPGYWASRRDPRGLYTPDGRCIARVACGCEDYPCCGH